MLGAISSFTDYIKQSYRNRYCDGENIVQFEICRQGIRIQRDR